WRIIVMKDDDQIAFLEPDASGHYSIALEAGRYTLQFAEPKGLGGGDLPKEITVRSGDTTEVNINIDTGIR
ncbi:carboxypeptidase-like regulatory domain-containing protein, partial [Candidatus Woesearchaeota archaeon]|nr:carboxypeptidase-like regulatory domain-containing protein [Candidatus Woesearchaeota archaeon]